MQDTHFILMILLAVLSTELEHRKTDFQIGIGRVETKSRNQMI